MPGISARKQRVPPVTPTHLAVDFPTLLLLKSDFAGNYQLRHFTQQLEHDLFAF